MPERIEELLRSLAPDAERVALEDSASVRRRGDQRSRQQVLGGVLAGVAILVGVAGAGGLVGDRKAADIPADPTPSVTTSVTDDVALSAEPFVRPADLAGLGGYDGIGPFIDADQEPVVTAPECRVRPAGWGATEVRATRFYQDGSEARVYEYVLRFADTAAARAAVDRVGSDLAGCVPVDPANGEVSMRPAGPVDGFPAARRVSRTFVPSVASEPSYIEAAAARRGLVLVVLDWSASANPAETTTGWVWTAGRLQSALDRATG